MANVKMEHVSVLPGGMEGTAQYRAVLTCATAMESVDQTSLETGSVTVRMVGMVMTVPHSWRQGAMMVLIMMEVSTQKT